jgi:hypothetical protein
MSLEPLQAAIAALASRCDFAQEQDGAGFNKSDTGIGHRLAALPTELWTADEARDAYDRIRKYAKQLESYGVDYRAIPKPELPDERPINWTRRVGLVRARRRRARRSRPRTRRTKRSSRRSDARPTRSPAGA